MNKRRFIVSLIGWGVLCLSFVFKVEATTIRLDRAKIRLNILPGNSFSGQINIENPSSEPVEIKAYLQDWCYTKAGDGTKEFYSAGATEFSCASWISFSPTEFLIPAFGQKTINYTVKVPSEAKGTHFAVLFFETTPQASEPEVGMMIKVRVGALFYIEAKGTTQRKAELDNFHLTQDTKKNLIIETDLLNIGNVDLVCEGTYHIIDKKGMVIARGEFNKAYTFPQDKVNLKATCKQIFNEGLYDIILTLDLGKAHQEQGFSGGPVLVKEVEFEIDEEGNIKRVGELR
ncbi:MAG: hypothetical protein NC900_05705 [Candidatus Omnitrophica bacterium]|nr:hypothetical protein [Candidatus Omnitrophota bacterium]